jgi:trk system potassium uptake protein TrkA
MRVVVIGLGLFGTSVAEGIASSGKEVLAIDRDEATVQQVLERGIVTQAACVDSTSLSKLRSMDIGREYSLGVIGIGTNMEASIVTTMHLKELGIPRVVAKAVHETHEKILCKVGANEVVIPEVASGKITARGIVNPSIHEEIEFNEGFHILEFDAPAAVTGKTLAESGLRQSYGANLIGYKRDGTISFTVTADHVIEPEDMLIIGISRANRPKLLKLAEQEV